MQFGPVPVDQALGCILAHSCVVGGVTLRKGLVLGPDAVAALQAADVAQITVARLMYDDVGEDAAAAQLAQAVVPDPATAGLTRGAAATGRVNLHAAAPGVVVLRADAITALNRIDPAITLATLPPFARVAAGTLVGTVKIITYGVSSEALRQSCAVARACLRVQPVTRGSAGLLLTHVAGQKPSINVKGQKVMADRLAALGMTLAATVDVAHEVSAIAAALRDLPGDMLLILTGSATSDLHDTAPEAVRAAGGKVVRFGMPVDPGNLLFIAQIGARPVIGLPGCARAPALNGADWVLERVACGYAPEDIDIADMGVGGLLKETPQRPHPREGRRARAVGSAEPS